MASALDSTHTVVVKSENRGIRVVIGALALILWARWWWTGQLFFAVASIVPAGGEDGEFQSITGTLLPIAVDLLWFVGSVIIWIGTNGIAVLWDVGSGLAETFRTYAARRVAVDAAQKAATEAGTSTASIHAGAIASTAAVDAAGQTASEPIKAELVQASPVLDPRKVVAILESHNEQIRDISGALETNIQQVMTLSHNMPLEKDFARHDDMLKAAEKALSRLNERLVSVEGSRATTADLISLADVFKARADHAIQAVANVDSTVASLQSELALVQGKLETLAKPAPAPAPSPAKPTRRKPTTAKRR